MHIKTTKIECSPNPKYFHNHSCRLKAVNRYKSLGFMETHIKNILRNISVNIGLYVRNDANIYKPYLINFTANLCQYMEKRVSGIYLSVFMKIITKNSNANHSCPYTGVIIAKNLYLDISLWPIFEIPKNSYKVLFFFYEGYPYDSLGTVAYYLEPVESKN